MAASKPSKPVEVLDKLQIANSPAEVYQQSVPVLLKKLGYPSGEISVGSIPDLNFHLEADGKMWLASYNAANGSVTGKPLETAIETLSFRRFLTRMHVAHGYTYSIGARWAWAVIVDVMSFVMVFWGFSGLLMWWQIKMTRVWGWLTLLASAATATVLAMGMWSALAQLPQLST